MKEKQYETPSMEFIVLSSQDVITLSVKNDYDPVIEGNGNPWAQ